MRIISLNAWGGKKWNDLLRFVTREAATPTVFCFQDVFDNQNGQRQSHDVRANLLSELEKVLPEHTSHYAPIASGYDFQGAVDTPLTFGLAMFVPENYLVRSSGSLHIPAGHNLSETYQRACPGSLQYLLIEEEKGTTVTIAHAHALWTGSKKGDSEERLAQSKTIREFEDHHDQHLLLFGDFDAEPNSRSTSIVRGDLRDLLREHGITTTKTSYQDHDMQWRQYVFATQDLKIDAVDALGDVISPGQPLVVQVE